ncbi:MAG TPA: chloride channel protein [Polyangia bacterium]|jgi:CIC family chloride channel protein|nr:chloride channel protein [Polyangia bacterium]
MKPVVAREFLATVLKEATPVDLRIVGRTLVHAALVGIVAGLMGAAFFAALEVVQRFLLEYLGGYRILRASGETFMRELDPGRPFRWWLLLFLPALGALGSGLVSQLAPETRGGGGDAMIDAFHRKGGVIRRRVAWVKALASMFTLGTGGAGGREGPTMQIGGALGSWVGSVLKVPPAERRILMVAGVAAGIAAVFRTPLGAALLAVEVLYRDDFESDALIPAVLASVTAYSVVISIFGESTLFAHPGRFPFIIRHLWLYGVLAILVTMLASLFMTSLRTVQRASAALKIPEWMKPALGGAALGAFCVPIILFVGWRLAQPGQGVGLLGGGYGAVQVAITGAPWLPMGWSGAALLLFLCFAKIIASSLTIGTGGSAGDFAPALVIGGLFGGAFGRAAHMLTGDPRIDAGAFALVAMGTFYGGAAHAPLSSLVLVCELAGSYDLLVPLMLAEGIAFVALRKKSLYHAQVATQRQSPVHQTPSLDILRAARVAQVMRPVSMSGVPVVAPDLHVGPDDDLRTATQTLLTNKLREIPVTDAAGQIVGLLDEADISRYFLDASTKTPPPMQS